MKQSASPKISDYGATSRRVRRRQSVHFDEEAKQAHEQLIAAHARLQVRIVELTVENEHLKRQLYGSKAERVHRETAQMSLLNMLEALQLLQLQDPAASLADGKGGEHKHSDNGNNSDEHSDDSANNGSNKPKPKPTRTKPHGRRALDETELPVERIVLEPLLLPDDAVLIGEEISSHVDYRPSSLVRVEVVRRKYLSASQTNTPASTRTCDDTPLAPVIADAPTLPISKGLAGPGLIARVLVNKFSDHLPLHRQERIFEREGFQLARSTLFGFVRGSTALLNHIVTAMWSDAKATAPVLMTDAAGVLVRQKERCRRAHFQVYVAPAQHVVFRYLRANNGEAIAAELAGFAGKLLCDASSVYHETFRRTPAVTEVGCWAHARRGFFQSLSTAREHALVGIGFISMLYDAHNAAKWPDGTIDVDKRRTLATPVLQRIKAWAQETRPKVSGRIEVALGYLDRHWLALTQFLDDGTLRLDNNLSELQLRHQVVGRKNWLFVASDSGGDDNATVVSLIASCGMHAIEPWAYLRDVLTVLPDWQRSRALELAPANITKTRENPEFKQLLEHRRLLDRIQHNAKPA